ncbi:hypothetical protein CW304_28555 [Bacillus sp. UFRGS-B20]|nr:hypothetical protein CW304_28555 [Bacillus sp. UFRGS-B20]
MNTHGTYLNRPKFSHTSLCFIKIQPLPSPIYHIKKQIFVCTTQKPTPFPWTSINISRQTMNIDSNLMTLYPRATIHSLIKHI